MPDAPTSRPKRRAHAFKTTHWSVVVTAGNPSSSPQAQKALATLYEAYWYPLYAYLRGRGCSTEDAEDLTQAFFARILEKGTLGHADPTRGRFRTFLLTALKNFAANEFDRARAGKRGGGIQTVALDVDDAESRLRIEPPSDETPERIFDRRWALLLLDRVVARLKSEMVAQGKETQYERLKGYLTFEQPLGKYGDFAVQLGMSEGAVKTAVHRLRQRFKTLLKDEVARTVSSPADLEDEIHHLLDSISH